MREFFDNHLWFDVAFTLATWVFIFFRYDIYRKYKFYKSPAKRTIFLALNSSVYLIWAAKASNQFFQILFLLFIVLDFWLLNAVNNNKKLQ